MAIKKGLNPKTMQAWIINPQRLREITTLTPSTSLKWVGFSFIHLLLTSTLLRLLLRSLLFFFFPQLPTLFPPGKGPFASLARGLNLHHFFLSLIDMSLFKYRVFAMGETPLQLLQLNLLILHLRDD